MDEGIVENRFRGGTEMKIAVLQPAYLPWLGFFDQMAHADRFVFLDDVQFTRRDWRNRNRIRTPEGWSWLTVPVLSKNRFRQTLRETRIDGSSDWRRKHIQSLHHHYSRAPHFDRYYPELEKFFRKEWPCLLDLCFDLIAYLKEALGIRTPTLYSSELNVQGSGEEKILNICGILNADHYLTGDSAQNYLNPETFEQSGITLEYQNYVHPIYPQQYPGFVPYLSVLDLLFNVGPQSLEWITRDAALAEQEA